MPWVFMLVCYAFFFAPPALCQEDDWSLTGLLQFRYKSRYLTDDKGDEHKFYQTADLTFRENRWNHFRFTLSGDLYQDLDGESDLKTVDRNRTVRDTWGDDVGGLIYIAQAEFYHLGAVDYIHLGRQYVKHELHTTHLDGVDVQLRLGDLEKRFKPYFYLGVPVRLYDDDSSYGDFSEFGTGIDFYSGRWTRLTCEYRYTEEDVPDDPDTYGSFRNSGKSTYQQSALALRHNLHGQGYGYGSLYFLNNKPRWIHTAFSTILDRLDLDIDATYHYQFEKIEDMPASGPLYTGMVGAIKPYHLVSFDFQKGLQTKDIWLSAGALWRTLDSGETESAFNHSYHREYVGITFENVTMKHLRVSAQVEYWQACDDDDDDAVVTFVGSAGYEVPDTFSLQAGSSYTLFKYDYFMDENEKQDVYTIYGGGRYYLQPKLFIDGRYDLDIYDIDEHRFSFTVGLEF